MSFNWESDTEELRDENCECGQRYALDVNRDAREAEYAITARPLLDTGSDIEYHELDADETTCVRCGEEVPFAEDLVEGPLSAEVEVAEPHNGGRAASDVSQNRTDVAVALTEGALGALPFIGPMVAAIVGTIIPNQRMDRIAEFLGILEEKLENLEQEVLQEKMRDEGFVDLFEDGTFQAARALSPERRERIAALLKNSLTNDDLDHIQEKQLLTLLGELNDAELIILQSYGLTLDPEAAQEFVERHQETIRGPLAFMGSPQSEADRRAVHETYRARLARLGLLRATYKKPKKGELPEWDLKTGMIKAKGYEVTPLGRLLLRKIDAGDPMEEFEEPGAADGF